MLEKIKTFFKVAAARTVEAQKRRADYIILTNMTDKDLHDIGITRGDIRDRVYNS